MEAVKKSSVPKILSERLFDKMKFTEFSREFIAVVDNYFP